MDAQVRVGRPTRAAIVVLVLLGLVVLLLRMLLPHGASLVRTENVSLPSLANVPASVWKTLSDKRIFFGHQSVGSDLLDGVRDLMATHPQIRLNVVTIERPDELSGPMLAHTRVGRNTDPQSKIDAFVKWIEGGVGDKADVAFFKFCYVDFAPETDVEALFASYAQTMARLKAAYPNTTFVHVTTPLMAMQAGPKAWVKRLLGRPVRGTIDNVVRCRFNTMLLAAYEGTEPVFDLAGAEATWPDGRRPVLEVDGSTFCAMVPSYTDDGGHLNPQGRRRVAEQFLVCLAALVK